VDAGYSTQAASRMPIFARMTARGSASGTHGSALGQAFAVHMYRVLNGLPSLSGEQRGSELQSQMQAGSPGDPTNFRCGSVWDRSSLSPRIDVRCTVSGHALS
jgi:hypothetical protein